MRRCLALAALFSALVPATGCMAIFEEAIDQSIEEGFDNLTPSFDGELRVTVDRDASLRNDRVQLGVFVSESTDQEITTADGEVVQRDFELWVDSSDRVVTYFADALDDSDIAHVTLEPVTLAMLEDNHDYSLTMPSRDQDIEYVVIAWYDADGDGKLDLSSTGESETTRPISKMLEYDGKDYPMVLVDVTPESDDDGWQGVAASGTLFVDYRNNWISDSETDGWYTNLETAKE